MLLDPGVAPGIVVAPLIGIKMHGAKVESGNGEVFLEIDALVAGVAVALFVVWEVRGRRC